MEDNKSYGIGKNYAGRKEIVMIGKCCSDENSRGNTFHDIQGEDDSELTFVLYEHLPVGTKVKVIIQVLED